MKLSFSKSNYLGLVLGLGMFAILSSATHQIFRPTQAPNGYTGADDEYCTSCHQGNMLNSTNGSVVASLPTSIAPDATYNFSVLISSTAAGRLRFGFAVKAVDVNGISVGTFSSNNSLANPSGDELGHINAVTAASALTSYTYGNLAWKAPATIPTGGVKFYVVGLAGNGAGSSGDFVYSQLLTATAAAPLAVNLLRFEVKNSKNGVDLSWSTSEEVNNEGFEVEKSSNGKEFNTIMFLKAKANKSNTYYYTDPETLVANTYYRLKHTDLNGKVGYSKIVKLEPSAKTLAASPNPNNGLITIPNFPSNSRVEVVSALGHTYKASLNNKNQLDISHLPKGVYMVTGFGIGSVKVVKE
jgi:hypothetical protein